MGDLVGQTISHFKIVEKIGHGGMGVVYRGVDLDLDRPVAIKVLPPETQQDADAVGRFLREAKLASRLQHPAITTIYEFGVWENQLYLVMEYVEGKTLKETIGGLPLALDRLLDLGCQMADAACAAHEKNIIHRDLKSDNVMVTPRGHIKILDFGLAKMVGPSQPKPGEATFQTSLGTVVGTVSHMSPEQVLGVELDGRTDVYSLGIVLFEMATGQLPFAGPNPSVILAKVLNAPPPSLNSVDHEIPKPLQQVIFRCLEKNRDQRIGSAMELLEQLRGVRVQAETDRKTQQFDLAQLLPQTAAMPAARVDPAPVSASVAASQPAAQAAAAPSAAPAFAPPPSAPQSASTASAAALKQPPTPLARLRTWAAGGLYFTISLLRGLVALAGAAVSLSCVALAALPVVALKEPYPDPLRMALPYLHQIVDPLYGIAAGLLNKPYRMGKLDLVFAVVIGGVYVAKGLLDYPLRHLQPIAKKWFRPKKVGRPRIPVPGAQFKPTSDRKVMLREYAAFQKVLMEAQKDLAFLSVDVVGSTKMKAGEDKLVIEHAFAEYKEFVDDIFQRNAVWKAAWTPDGVMTCFFKPDDAVGAAQELLSRLGWFNANSHRMRSKFQVRCGVHSGKVTIHDSKPLEEVSDEVIDVAGHMQKYAATDAVWISEETLQLLTKREGFQPEEKQVDGHAVHTWRAPKSA